MLRSKPNANKETLFGKKKNKLILENKSTYEIRYEASIYEGKQIINRENGGNISAGGIGVGLSNKTEYSKSEPLDVEQGVIPPNDCNHVTVDDSKKVMIRYYYIGLHNDFTDERRNFTVEDIVYFEQPTQEKIDQIKNQIQEEEKLKVNQESNNEAKSMPCASTFKNMCEKNCVTSQCPHCKHFYCSYHLPVSSSIKGGHACY